MNAAQLTSELKKAARDAGFSLSGACPAVSPSGVSALARWLARGYAGQMAYLGGRSDAYRHPEHVLEGAKSLLVLGLSYNACPPRALRTGQGRVSRYAWSRDDYHDVVHRRLKQLCRCANQLAPEATVRGVVDTAPLLEREFAQLAGLGWIGKNTMLMNRREGSWLFLAAVLLDCELHYDAPFPTAHCGSCTSCLDACPTNAFPEPFVLDATRCISYLTIELRGPIPRALRSAMGDWLFGCDICQDVCPWNRKAVPGDAAFDPDPRMNPADLTGLFELDDDAFRTRFRWTPLWRARRRGLLRNAALVLGNQRDPAATSTLVHALHDRESLVRGAAAWALGRLATPRAKDSLRRRLAAESDPEVTDEIQQALAPQSL